MTRKWSLQRLLTGWVCRMNKFFDFSGIDSCEVTIRKTWNEFRQKLSVKEFSYSDIDAALQTVFLKTFDDIFQSTHQHLDKSLKDVFSDNACVIRAARLKTGEPDPEYSRFIPNAAFMTEHNRFSPPDVEWLYLAFSFKKSRRDDFSIAEKCALKECRAVKGERFALCEFKLDKINEGKKVVDLTIADNIEYDEINLELSQVIKIIYDREVRKGISALRMGLKPKANSDDIKPEIEKWTVYTHVKLMSEQIFVPLTTEDKSIMYAPFQCLAQYFLSKGYYGIVYSSTVFPEGKNIVLFDKKLALPVGTIKKLTIPESL